MHLRRPCRPPSTPCHRLKASPSNDTPCSPVERRLRGGQTSTPLPPPSLHKEMDLPRYLRRVNLLPVIPSSLSLLLVRLEKKLSPATIPVDCYSQNSLQDVLTFLNPIYRIKYNISISARREARKLVSTRRILNSFRDLFSPSCVNDTNTIGFSLN